MHIDKKIIKAMSSEPTLRTLEFTEKHLNNPERFAPPEKPDDSEKKDYIRFTVLDSQPICSITQDPFKIGEIIAVCNKCFAAFLARTLKRYFLSTKITEPHSVCSICNANLTKNDLKLPHLEKLRTLIDLKKEEIELLEYKLEQTERSSKDSIKTAKVHIRLLEDIEDTDDNSSTEEDEIKLIVSESQNSERKSLDSLKESFESQIKELNARIQEKKRELAQLETLENSIISRKKSIEKKRLYNNLLKNAAVASTISLLFFGSYRLIQSHFFCLF